MSLVNDMLKDLEPAHSQSKAPHPSPQNTVQQSRKPLNAMLLPALAIVAVIAYVVFYFLGGNSANKSDISLKDLPGPRMVDSKWVDQTFSSSGSLASTNSRVQAVQSASNVALVKPEIEQSAMTAGEHQVGSQTNHSDLPLGDQSRQQDFQGGLTRNSDTKVDSRENAQLLNTLLDKAERAFGQNHLLTPLSENAYQLYRSVLIVDPGNSQAQQGLEKVYDRYSVWAQRAVSRGDLRLAKVYQSKAKVVFPERDFVVGEGLSTLPAGQEGSDVPVKKRSIVQLSSADRDKRYLRDLSGGLTPSTLSAIQKDIKAGVPLPKTLVAMMPILPGQLSQNEQNEFAKSLELQAQGGDVLFEAYRKIHQNDFDQAKSILSSAELSPSFEQPRLSLLGAICQRLSEYACALDSYKKSVELAPSQVTDWLGLAVSAEASGLSRESAYAYQKVLTLKHPDSRVMAFSRRRLHELKSIDSSKVE